MQEQVIKVFHQEGGKLIHVANVKNSKYDGQHEALEYAYFRSQNINGSWSKGPQVLEIGPSFKRELVANGDYSSDIEVVEPIEVIGGMAYGHRSSMVGDIFEIEGQKFIVASFGFKPVEMEVA